MNRHPRPGPVPALAFALTPDERAAIRRRLDSAMISVFSAEHETLPELEAVFDQLVAAFDAGRARRIRERLQTAMVRAVVADVGVPEAARDIVGKLMRQIRQARDEAGRLICLAADPSLQDLADELQSRPADPLVVMELVLILDKATKAVASEHANEARHAYTEKAKDWVLQEWADHGAEYEGKRDFAGVYVPLIAARFKDRKGDPLKVKAETIYQDWLPKG